MENISENTLIGALNEELNQVNKTKNILHPSAEVNTIPEVAKYYKKNNQNWVIIGDENYGEGYEKIHPPFHHPSLFNINYPRIL